MKVYLLTSSRADYGIYLPLLKKLDDNIEFDLKVVIFGTHLSKFHGYTAQHIYDDGFKIAAEIETVLANDSEESISTSMGLTMMKFADFWRQHHEQIDLVISLGDRYEMFAAVASSVPFNLPIAHLHGGETTLGAIDDKLRHSITLFSKYHFTSTKAYAQRVSALIGNDKYVWNVGALSLDNLTNLKLLSKSDFKEKFAIDLDTPTVLVTFHPETVALEKNRIYIQCAIAALEQLLNSYQVVITMPNSDTAGNIIREAIVKFGKQQSKVVVIENFGTQGYFTCMKYCSFLLGNTSSGIIEAASFGKYVVNVGDRQKGRITGENVIHVAFDEKEILNAIESINRKPNIGNYNVYFNGNATERIIQILSNEV